MSNRDYRGFDEWVPAQDAGIPNSSPFFGVDRDAVPVRLIWSPRLSVWHRARMTVAMWLLKLANRIGPGVSL